MLDLGFVRENLPLLEEKLRQRGLDPAETLKDFVDLDRERRRFINEMETLRAEQNRASEEIARAKKEGRDPGARAEELRGLRERIRQAEEQANQRSDAMREVLTRIPNLPHSSVPVGGGAEQNAEVRRWGAAP